MRADINKTLTLLAAVGLECNEKDYLDRFFGQWKFVNNQCTFVFVINRFKLKLHKSASGLDLLYCFRPLAIGAGAGRYRCVAYQSRARKYVYPFVRVLSALSCQIRALRSAHGVRPALLHPFSFLPRVRPVLHIASLLPVVEPGLTPQNRLSFQSEKRQTGTRPDLSLISRSTMACPRLIT
jgi:hypothetical protein